MREPTTAVFDELRAEWEALVGPDRIADLQDALVRLLGTGGAEEAMRDVRPGR